MSSFLPWAVESLIASTLLMIVALAVRTPVRRAFGPNVAYALWLLPALRLILPPLPEQWHHGIVAPVARATDQFAALVDQPLVSEPILTGGIAAPAIYAPTLGPALILLWIGGAAAFMLFHSIAHARFCRRLIAQCSDAAALPGGVKLIETSAAKGPLAFGIWRRYVAFPSDFAERYDADERDLALAHELGHHARGDLVANWAGLAVLAMHWFNPIAWRAFRAFRADQEIANDARVLAGRDAVTRHLYACAIVKAAHGGAVSAACHLHTIDDLKGRLRMLNTNRMSRSRLAGGVGMLALLGAVGLGATASGTQAAEQVRAKVERTTGLDIAKMTIPTSFQAMSPAPPPASTVGVEVSSVPAVPAPPHSSGEKHHYEVIALDGNKTVMADQMADGARLPEVRTRVIRRNVRRVQDGGVATEDFRPGVLPPVPPMPRMPSIPAMPPMPQVSNATCGYGGARAQPVLHDVKNGQKRIIICTDRIETMARRGAQMASNGRDMERDAYAKALEGLRARRSAIAADARMNQEGRSGALEGIDEAIKELESDLAAHN